MTERIGRWTALVVAVTALIGAIDGFARQASSVSCGVWVGFPWCECDGFETVAACRKAQELLKEVGLL